MILVSGGILRIK